MIHKNKDKRYVLENGGALLIFDIYIENFLKVYEVRCRESLKGALIHTLLMIKKTITQKRIAHDWTCSSGKPNTLIRARGLQWSGGADKISRVP